MGSERILVVDDEPQIREMLQAALEDAGYDCATAPEADTALHMLSDQPYDLVLLDVIMPRMSGADLFYKVRETHPNIAAIFLTARADLELAVGSMRLGAYDYLVKPVSMERLVKAAQLALQRRKALLAANSPEQSRLAESYKRQLDALNQLMQARILQQGELELLAQRVANAARTTAEVLLKLADETAASPDSLTGSPMQSYPEDPGRPGQVHY